MASPDHAPLVRVSDACCLAPTLADRLPPTLVAALGAAAFVGAMCLVLVTPLLSLWGLCGVVAGLLLAGFAPSQHRGTLVVDPAEIYDRDVHAAYRRLVAAHEELAGALASRRDTSPLATTLLDRSCAAVVDGGRIARIVNEPARYLAHHDRSRATERAARLRADADAATDEAARELGAAATASERHIALLDELAAFRDRVRGQLECAAAAIETTTAELVLHTAADDERAAPARDDLADDLAAPLAALRQLA